MPGVTNLLGQRFLSDSEALAPILTYLNRARALFLRQWRGQPVGAAQRGRARSAFPRRRAARRWTRSRRALEIDRRLSDLETQARANGSAVGSAFLYPVSVARIAAWARGLQSRGFVLVPGFRHSCAANNN